MIKKSRSKRDFVDNKIIETETTDGFKVSIKDDEPNDISNMLSKTVEVLRREVTHLLGESTNGKLSRSSSADLVAYVKLLSDLHQQEQETLSNLSEKELEEFVNK